MPELHCINTAASQHNHPIECPWKPSTKASAEHFSAKHKLQKPDGSLVEGMSSHCDPTTILLNTMPISCQHVAVGAVAAASLLQEPV